MCKGGRIFIQMPKKFFTPRYTLSTCRRVVGRDGSHRRFLGRLFSFCLLFF